MVNAFHNMSILLMLVMPLLTMRIFAEENRAGTTEFLLSLPLGEPAIVFGKFLAALAVLGLMIGGTATTLVPLTAFGHPDLGPVIGGYLGVSCWGPPSWQSGCSSRPYAATSSSPPWSPGRCSCCSGTSTMP